MALVDFERQVLVLARDQFGIKPLYYHLGEDRLFFASELKALMELPELRSVDAQMAFDYLAYAQVDHAEGTFIAGVRQVPAASYVEIDMGSRRPVMRFERYWALDLDRRIDVSAAEAASEFRRIFLESISLHLRSDVPLGSCLSGGIDSSAIVCAVAELTGAENERHTFSYVARQEGIDEARYAELVNRHTGATAHYVEASPAELIDDVQELIRIQDYPFGSP